MTVRNRAVSAIEKNGGWIQIKETGKRKIISIFAPVGKAWKINDTTVIKLDWKIGNMPSVWRTVKDIGQAGTKNTVRQQSWWKKAGLVKDDKGWKFKHTGKYLKMF